MLSNIGANPQGSVAGSSSAPSVEDSSVRSAAPAKNPGGSGASGDATPTAAPVTQDHTQLVHAVEAVKEAIASTSLARDLHFTIDQDTGQTVVTVIDAASKKVIRQIPSEEMLQIARTFKAAEKTAEEKAPIGVLLKQKA
jgi:flagellar protein FlaG